MIKYLFILYISISSLYAQSSQEISKKRYEKIIKKGKKIAHLVCDEKKLSQIKATKRVDIYLEIERLKPCLSLHKRDIEALSYFLSSKDVEIHKIYTIKVAKDSKCPVCGMFIEKYPKWVAYMKINKRDFYFDGVKDMMKYYIFDVDFPYNRDNIKDIKVTDFYTLKEIDAKEAFYVIGSDIYGPMGDELIPFEREKEAKNFIKEHNGDKILKFKEITPKLIMALDGLDI